VGLEVAALLEEGDALDHIGGEAHVGTLPRETGGRSKYSNRRRARLVIE